MIKYSSLFVLLLFCFSCGEEYVPKPKAELRLEYPSSKYIDSNL